MGCKWRFWTVSLCVCRYVVLGQSSTVPKGINDSRNTSEYQLNTSTKSLSEQYWQAGRQADKQSVCYQHSRDELVTDQQLASWNLGLAQLLGSNGEYVSELPDGTQVENKNAKKNE